MNDDDDRHLSPRALLRTMAISAALAAAVSACNKSMDKPGLPQAPKPQAEAAGGEARVMHAIYTVDGKRRAFFTEGEMPEAGDSAPRKLVIRT
jgi:hypothetical protein